jgi:hypothetical protein
VALTDGCCKIAIALIDHLGALIYRAPHNFRYTITNPTAMPTPSAIFATRSLR